MKQPTTTTYAWCFSHGRLHHFDDEPWCTATWAILPGATEDEALATKEERYGDAEFLHQLRDDQQIALIDARRDASEAAAKTINDGLETLFRRLGPPPTDTKEK
ncbi:hypothetical protein [Streptomyces sp. 5-6(2022)]|uniref:hypothetical protein n=1 Tax=Streptomyces sp. 5-6(2022) TaxID=2936510 RepID=UPI0023B9D2E7|nr:hypothetical protein [Streptomyces sp. 5-6(2022)]